MGAILFICVENRARSQMAAEIAKKILGPNYRILSAGSRPALNVHPLTEVVLKEIGIATQRLIPQDLKLIDLGAIEHIITLCADEDCPILPGNIKKSHWPLPDPARNAKSEAEQLINFREVRDRISKLIHENFKTP